MSLDACTYVGELTVCVDMVDDRSDVCGLAWALSLTLRGMMPDGRSVTCDNIAWRRMVSLLVCTLIYHVLCVVKMLLRK